VRAFEWSVASVGVSLTWAPSNALSAQLSYGAALVDAGDIASGDVQDDGIHFRVTLRPLSLFRRSR